MRRGYSGGQRNTLPLHAPLVRGRRVQGRAFALYSKAREGGGRVTADDAIRQAQQATLFNRVGRGGLGEAAAEQLGGSIGDAGGEDEEGGHHLLLGAGRRDDAVAKTGAGVPRAAAWAGVGRLQLPGAALRCWRCVVPLCPTFSRLPAYLPVLSCLSCLCLPD